MGKEGKPERDPGAVFRKLAVGTWGDGKFRQLSAPPASAQWLWLYLLSGPCTTRLPGLMSRGPAGLAEELGWSTEDLKRCFAELVAQGMAKADWGARVIWVPNAVKHNLPDNSNNVKGWLPHIRAIPDCNLKTEAIRHLHDVVSTERNSEYAECLRDEFPTAFEVEPLRKPLFKLLPKQSVKRLLQRLPERLSNPGAGERAGAGAAAGEAPKEQPPQPPAAPQVTAGEAKPPGDLPTLREVDEWSVGTFGMPMKPGAEHKRFHELRPTWPELEYAKAKLAKEKLDGSRANPGNMGAAMGIVDRIRREKPRDGPPATASPKPAKPKDAFAEAVEAARAELGVPSIWDMSELRATGTTVERVTEVMQGIELELWFNAGADEPKVYWGEVVRRLGGKPEPKRVEKPPPQAQSAAAVRAVAGQLVKGMGMA